MKISDNVKNKLYEAGLVPVIKPVAGTDGAALADALYRGGVYAAEVTFRAAGAAELIAAMRKARPELTVGAGTVLTEDQADEAVEAGAQFCVAPGFNQRVAAHCISLGVPFVPGVSSATQIEAAMEAGLDFVKFFPAEQSGGLAAITALSAPYRDMSFMPPFFISSALSSANTLTGVSRGSNPNAFFKSSAPANASLSPAQFIPICATEYPSIFLVAFSQSTVIPA